MNDDIIELLTDLSRVQAIGIEYSKILIKKYGNLASIHAVINNICSMISYIKSILLSGLVVNGKVDILKGTPFENFTPSQIFSNDFEEYDYDFVVNYIIPNYTPSKSDAISQIMKVINLIKRTNIRDKYLLLRRLEDLAKLISGK